MLKKLTYYIDQGNGTYKPFYEYKAPDVGIDEFYARQLCTYFIMRGTQYELLANEMEGDEDVLVLKEIGRNYPALDEENFHGKGLYIEFRSHDERENYKKLVLLAVNTHFEIIRYLLKDIVDVPGQGLMETTSTEIDEDRSVYVIYVKPLEEDVA
jgi:hypothetical protein